MNLIVEFIGNYSSNNYLHKYSKHYEKNDSMQIWLQRTVGFIALISLFFLGASLWGCVWSWWVQLGVLRVRRQWVPLLCTGLGIILIKLDDT